MMKKITIDGNETIFNNLVTGNASAVIGMINNRDMRTAMIGDKVLHNKEYRPGIVSTIEVYELDGTKLTAWVLSDNERRKISEQLVKACESAPVGPNSGCVGWPYDEYYYGDCPHGSLVNFMWRVFKKRITAREDE